MGKERIIKNKIWRGGGSAVPERRRARPALAALLLCIKYNHAHSRLARTTLYESSSAPIHHVFAIRKTRLASHSGRNTFWARNSRR